MIQVFLIWLKGMNTNFDNFPYCIVHYKLSRIIQLRTQPRPPPPLSPPVLTEPKTSQPEGEEGDPQESDKEGLTVEENSRPEEKISEEVIETTDAKVINTT